MEPEVRAFLIRIVNTIFMGLLWMLANTTLGIMYNLAFPGDKISVWNICYYIFFLVSLFLLIRYYIRLWKKDIDIPQ